MNPGVVVVIAVVALVVGLLIGKAMQPKRKFGMAEAYKANEQLAHLPLPTDVADQAAPVAVVAATIMGIPVTLSSEVRDHVAKLEQENAERRDEIKSNEKQVETLEAANENLADEIVTANADATRANALTARYLRATA